MRLSIDAVVRRRGEVPERLNGHAWKACVGASSPQVRILSSPPFQLQAFGLPNIVAHYFATQGSIRDKRIHGKPISVYKIFTHSLTKRRLTNSRVKTMFKNETLLNRINEISRINKHTATSL